MCLVDSSRSGGELLPFFAQRVHQCAEAKGKFRFGQNLLRGEGIADQVLREKIPEHSGIVHFAGGFDEGIRQFDAARNKSGADFLQFASQAMTYFFVVDYGWQRFGAADEVGLLLLEPGELDAAQSLQDELARAVGLLDARAHQARRRRRSASARGLPPGVTPRPQPLQPRTAETPSTRAPP